MSVFRFCMGRLRVTCLIGLGGYLTVTGSQWPVSNDLFEISRVDITSLEVVGSCRIGRFATIQPQSLVTKRSKYNSGVMRQKVFAEIGAPGAMPCMIACNSRRIRPSRLFLPFRFRGPVYGFFDEGVESRNALYFKCGAHLLQQWGSP